MIPSQSHESWGFRISGLTPYVSYKTTLGIGYASMGCVYGGSGLNIAASSALDGSSGCFIERLYTWRCQVQIKTEDQFSRYDCVPAQMYYSSLSSMPLAKRGWALQERLLPSRTLHFTSKQVFWECHQKVACETFPEEFPTSIAYANSYLKKQPVSRSVRMNCV
jgi:hypothetical protein